MQGDVSTPRTGDDFTYASSGIEGMVEEKQPLDYLFDTYDATAHGISRVASFLADRPLLAGSIALGLVGAVVGSRVAEYQARRQRRSFYQKAMGTLGSSSALVSDWFTRKPRQTAEAIRERSRGLVGQSHNGKAGTRHLPVLGREQKGGRGFGQQIGYAVGLIPPILALVRNPLVRDMGVRMLTRRVTNPGKK